MRQSANSVALLVSAIATLGAIPATSVAASSAAVATENAQRILVGGGLDGVCERGPRRLPGEALEPYTLRRLRLVERVDAAIDVDCLQRAFTDVEMENAAAQGDLIGTIAQIILDPRPMSAEGRCSESISFGAALASRASQLPSVLYRELLFADGSMKELCNSYEQALQSYRLAMDLGLFAARGRWSGLVQDQLQGVHDGASTPVKEETADTPALGPRDVGRPSCGPGLDDTVLLRWAREHLDKVLSPSVRESYEPYTIKRQEAGWRVEGTFHKGPDVFGGAPIVVFSNCGEIVQLLMGV